MATQQANTQRQGNAAKKGQPAPRANASPAASQSSSGSVERDETYGLVSVLYHSLQGAETYSAYIADAQRAGEEELVSFFRQCQEQENQRALRAKELLAAQLEDLREDEEEAASDDEDEEDDEDDEEEDEE